MRRLATGGALVMFAASTLVACGGPSGREYAVPDTFCGTKLPAQTYEPLFPSGSDLDVQRSFADFSEFSASRRCIIKVDGEDAIRAEAGGFDFEEQFEFYGLAVDIDDAVDVPGEFAAFVLPHVAAASAPCHVPNFGDYYIIRELRLVLAVEAPEDDEESMRVLSEMIQPFMAEAVAMTPCQENEDRD